MFLKIINIFENTTFLRKSEIRELLESFGRVLGELWGAFGELSESREPAFGERKKLDCVKIDL